MNENIFAICDTDAEYAQRLVEYIGDKPGVVLKAMVFTHQESLLEYLRDNSIDILLIVPELIGEELLKQNIQRIILLSSGLVSSDFVKYPSVYKYQSSEVILKEMLNFLADIKKDQRVITVPREDVEIIGVYTPAGQIEQRVFSWIMGQILSAEYSVLYINMEEFSIFEKVFHTMDSGDLSDVMYFYRQNPDTLSLRLPSVINHSHGVDYIPPLLYSENLRNVKTEEWVRMIRKIAQVGTYDVIIIDIGNMLENIFEMIDMCHVSYMPVDSRWISLMKVSAYEEYLLKSDKQDILNKTRKIDIPEISVDKLDETYFEQQMRGGLGNTIRKVLREVA